MTRNIVVAAGVAIVAFAIVMMVLDSVSERDGYRRFALDVSSLKACLVHPVADVTESGDNDEDRPPLPVHHRCEMYVLALTESARDPAVQRERDRVQHLLSAIRVTLDAVRPDERRALDFLAELELLARP